MNKSGWTTDRFGARGTSEKRAVTAFFDDRAAVRQAVDDLTAAGVARDRITMVEGSAEDPVAVQPVPSADRGIWDIVKDLFMADEDRHAYGEGLRRGGFLLSVMTGAADHDRIVDILDREGAVDMDARQSDWELEGWDPVRASADLRSAASLGSTAPSRPADDVRADEPRAATGGSVVRDTEAEGLRLRTYVASRARPDALK